MGIRICVISPVQPIREAPGGGAKRFFADYSDFVKESTHDECDFLSIRKCHSKEIIESITNPLLSLILLIRIVSNTRRKCYNIIYSQDSIYCGVPSIIASKILKVPVIVHYHNSPTLIYEAIRKQGMIKNLSLGILSLLETVVLTNSDYIICTNTSLKEYIKLKIGGGGNVFVVPMGTDFIKYYEENEHIHGTETLKKNSITIGYIGRLDKGKGLNTLIDAFARLSNRYASRNSSAEVKIELIFIGDGDAKEELICHVNSLCLDSKIKFLGYINNVQRILPFVDIFVYPSKSEGCPLSILEAMAFRIPVVASDIQGINEIIKDNQNGMLFQVGDVEGLAQKLNILCANQKLRDNLGENALLTIKSDYSKNNNLKRIHRIIQSLGGYHG
jgi:glycosyltransferase involved in cell wall biosynthesis